MRETPRTTSYLFWTVAQYALVVGLSSLLTFWKLGVPALENHEAYVAVTARNMATPEHWLNPDIAEGSIPPNTSLNHWLIPVFNGEPRVVKTPLAYWCVAGLMKLGLPANEFTARLPSALASVALAVVVLALGRSMFSPRAALLGALMFATSVTTINWGRNARPDMQMTLWITVTMACIYWGLGQSSTWRKHLLVLAAYVALGLANLAKELVPLFVLLPAMLYLCWEASCAAEQTDRPRRLLIGYLILAAVGFVLCSLVRIIPVLQWWSYAGLGEGMGIAATMAVTLGSPVLIYMVLSRVWRTFLPVLPTTLVGIALMLAMFVPWMLYVSHVLPEARHIFTFQTVDRALGTEGWLARSAVPVTGYYLLSMAKQSLPWVVFLPGALMIPLMKRWREDRDALVFLLLWVFGLVLLFSVSVGKHEQYILPAVPAVCLLMGYCAEDVFFGRRWIQPKLARTIVTGYAVVTLLAVVAGLVAMAVVQYEFAAYVHHILIIASLTLVPGWLAVWALWRGRPAVAAAMMVLAVLAGELAFVTRATLWGHKWEDYAQFGRTVAKEVPPEAELVAWEVPDPAIVWYSGRELPLASQQEARWVRMYGKEAGEKMWCQWLSSGRWPFYVVGKETSVRELSGLGFEPIASIVATEDSYCLFRR